jgi:magnesium-transporting ATPase (P-type)
MIDMDADIVGVVELYRHATQEIRWGKQQQWQLAYYAVLLFGAIHILYGLALHEKILCEHILRSVISFLALLSLFMGAWIVISFQVFLVNNRRVLQIIYSTKHNANSRKHDFRNSYVTRGFLDVRDGERLNVGFFKDWFVWAAVVLLFVIATLSVQIRAFMHAPDWICAWVIADLLFVSAVIHIGWCSVSGNDKL